MQAELWPILCLNNQIFVTVTTGVGRDTQHPETSIWRDVQRFRIKWGFVCVTIWLILDTKCMDLTLGYITYYSIDGTLKQPMRFGLYTYVIHVHSALLIFGIGFGRNKLLNSASVSFSAETTLLLSAPFRLRCGRPDGSFSIADKPIRRVAKFRENRCRDGWESVSGNKKKLDVKHNNWRSVLHRNLLLFHIGKHWQWKRCRPISVTPRMSSYHCWI